MAGVLGLEEAVAKLSRQGRDPGASHPPDTAPAAVAAILREGEAGGGAELFFIRRALSPKDPWSGHVAFPGGGREPADESLLATAIRETWEEVGIDLGRAELVCRLPDVPAIIRTKRGRMVVTPFVFALREPVTPVPNDAEVAGVFWVPLTTLMRGEGRGTHTYTWQNVQHEAPCVRLEPDQHVLWGMTHQMMMTMLEALA
ncbi:MAG: MutT/nudix family protein [Labilithrix sp.]|nr:MutT/nudix family protein [Labilithrix sp.]